MTEMKYEITGSSGMRAVWYGPGYPRSDQICCPCFTMWGAKRKIRRHKRKIARGKIDPVHNPYDIVYTEKRITEQDVETRIRELERELGISP